MKRFLGRISTAALALISSSVLAVAQSPPSPDFSWAGPYVGAHVGAAIPSFSATGYAAADSLAAGPLSITTNFGGGLFGEGGIYAGYNLQPIGGLVLGAEADFNFTNIAAMSGQFFDLHAGSGGCNNLTSSYVCLGPVNSNVNWYGTVRGTVGQATGPLMVFATGGLAYGQVESSVSGTWKFATQVPASSFFDMKTSAVQFGWTAGIGGAVAINNNTSLRLEWNHVDLGERTIGAGSGTVPSPSVNYAASVTQRVAFDVVRVGLTIHFP